MTTSSFRQAAEKRIRELEARDTERKIAAEQRAVEDRATQAELRARREQAQREAAEQAAAEMRGRLTRRFGIAGTKLDLHSEVYLFVLEHRDIAVAYTRSPGDDRRTSWQHQARLQRILNTGVDPPLIVTGAQIATYAESVGRLAVDPSVDELAALNPTSRGTT